MRKIEYNSFDVILRKLVYFFTTLLSFLLASTYLIANEIGYKEVFSSGRAVIINGDTNLAKKRALEDALYLATIQGGAKVDGYSSVDTNTNLNESVLVRPSATIKDFVITQESSDDTHYNVTVRAYLVSVSNMLNCSDRDFVNLTYLSPHYTISSRLPAWTTKLPNEVSKEVFKNLLNIEYINLKDSSKFPFNPNKVLKKSVSLDYNNLVEGQRNDLKNGEFAIHPVLKFSHAKGRFTKVSKEIVVDITLNIYEGPNFNVLDSLSYKFSLWSGNQTGYQHVDAFVKISQDKLTDLVKKSISKIQYRVLDQLKCQPLQAEVILVNNELTVPLGSNQGLKKGTVGFISSSRDVIMSEWIVLTVRDTNENTSTLEPLNPQNKNNQIQGKTIKFIN
ncbi:MAG: flagellar assembly protein T N-terminal domain-containing protein [Alphaproteobacteria bacterium]